MSILAEVFGRTKILLPVVHVADEEQALRNTDVARDAGADGVFLINHGMSYDRLLDIHRVVHARHADWWIGVNCLDLYPVEVMQIADDTIAGIWVDNAMIDEDADEQPEAEAVLEVRRQKGWNGLYFGGVAFKYQRPVNDLARAATVAARFMDVVTTSGPGTGLAAEQEKIRIMKQALGDRPLAIASGITPENIADYLPVADAFLVATGISRSFEELDPERAARLAQTIHASS
ncbi:MAG: adenine phosphoribosyltransferase [Planctomycetota bacterium]|nr:MAG: adenine phosphoribosyltransferase [Planctomycetota bacterium]